MMYVILALGLLGISVPSASSQLFSSICPTTLDTVPNFDIKQYAGRWYEYARYLDPSEANAKCIISEYTLNHNGTVAVQNYGIDSTTKAFRGIRAIAIIPNKADASKLIVNFPSYTHVPQGKYWVLGTDYENYSIVFACRQITPTTNRPRTWLLTRARNPSQKVIDEAKMAASCYGIDTSLYLPTDQTNCGN